MPDVMFVQCTSSVLYWKVVVPSENDGDTREETCILCPYVIESEDSVNEIELSRFMTLKVSVKASIPFKYTSTLKGLPRYCS